MTLLPSGKEERGGTDPGRDTGSFRDPAGVIFSADGRLFRTVHPRAVEDWKAFSASPLFGELQRERLLIPTQPAVLDPDRLPVPADACAALLEHERIPFVSYPYEWSFGMLQAAALLNLDLLERCLPHDFILKDATGFNVQFLGVDPIFIDVLSFTRRAEGDPWIGYHQFCKMFLYPLMLQAYKGVPFQSWLRSELEGLDPVSFSQLMSARDWLRPGVFVHVELQAAMQKRLAAAPYSVRGAIRSAGLSKQALAHNFRSLRRLLVRLEPKDTESAWVEYQGTHSYNEVARQQKEEFVRQVSPSRRWRLVWDLGCNIGQFSRIAGEYADYVVALDADPSAIEVFAQGLKQEQKRNILPLVMNLTNLSPDQGWEGRERQSLPARGRPQLTLCLALLHHLVIGANIPLESVLGWLARLRTAVIIEFVSKDDPMVQRLLLNKEDTYDDYERSFFERCLHRRFRVEKTQALSGGTRFLYFGTPVA